MGSLPVTGETCRTSTNFYSIPEFKSRSCADCFKYTYVNQNMRQNYNISECVAGIMICQLFVFGIPNNCSCDNPNVVFNVPEFAEAYKGLFTPLDELTIPSLPSYFYKNTKECCKAASDCCDKMQQKRRKKKKSHLKRSHHNNNCPSTWDGWQCFEESEPGIVHMTCPSFLYEDSSIPSLEKFKALKNCTSQGFWYKNKQSKQEWTDYSSCDIHHNPNTATKLIWGISAYSISVIGMIPAILIFAFQPSLASQPMFIIHKHFLLSFFFYGFFFIFNYLFFFMKGAPGEHFAIANDLSCRILSTIQLRYFRLTNFTWMLAEGVHLYRLLQSPLGYSNELNGYFVMCWGFPAIVTIIYAFLRFNWDNNGCWVASEYPSIEWIIIGPCLLMLAINALQMTSIMFTLVKKLKYNPHMEPVQYRKAVRAAILLMPIFGLHFIFTIYRVDDPIYSLCNELLDGLQGLLVSIIVCYTNKSVIELYRNRFKSVEFSDIFK
uniref:G_PROTEIN_RECEP_F2_4 domain-containing protein n=1 Tax=Rhabditophanes sp. KR3021 TaxID=114890 RepID=A0AC35TS02_9BILA